MSELEVGLCEGFTMYKYCSMELILIDWPIGKCCSRFLGLAIKKILLFLSTEIDEILNRSFTKNLEGIDEATGSSEIQSVIKVL